MHKALADLNIGTLNIETLKKYAPEALQTRSVTAVLLALGSNYQVEKYLPRVRETLAVLGDIELSTAFQNPDFTATKAQSKPDYTNQCVYLSLIHSMTLNELQHIFKQFEEDCDRQRLAKSNGVRQVTMDIDILLIKLAKEKSSLSNESMPQWVVMKDRCPFKTHERAGIDELIARYKT